MRKYIATGIVALMLAACSKNEEVDLSLPAEVSENAGVDTDTDTASIKTTAIYNEKFSGIAQGIDLYLNEQKFNGVALVSSGDTIILQESYGYANMDDKELLENDDIFQIASVSKSFAAVSALQLVEKGLLKLDQPVSDFFPDMPNAHLMTIHNLLTHTSGLYSDNMSYYSKETPLEETLSYAFKQNNLRHGSVGPVTYSNLGYDLLGAIIEQITGKTYAEYIDENIIKPAGMTSTALNMKGELIENLVTPYNGNIADNYEAKYFHPSFGYASGGIHSTALDLFKYDRALANNKLISAKSYDLLGQEYSSIGSKPYGYGFYTNVYNINNVISHPGHLIGWHSMYLRENNDKVSVILLTNHDESDMNMAYYIAQFVLQNID